MTNQPERVRSRRATRGALAVACFCFANGCNGGSSPPGNTAPPTGLARLNHLVVIVLENWSFDSLYGEMPGAEGFATRDVPPQVDASGAPYVTLPQTETHVPQTLPNAPFALSAYVPLDAQTSTDLTNNFYEEQRQIHGGRMDQFVLYDAAAKGLTMGYYQTNGLPLAEEARKYTLCDHFFHGVFGGSLQNHIFLVSAGVAQFSNAPSSIKRAVLDDAGEPVADASGKFQDGPLTPDGYVVGTLFPAGGPHPPSTPAEQLVPPQKFATIGDRLTAKGLDWGWYAEGWNEILSGPTLNDAGTDPTTLFQYNHQPFAYFDGYGEGQPGRAHLRDESELMTAAANGTLPAVSFVKPDGIDNEHPNYADMIAGELHTRALIDAVRNGPAWADTAIIVTYDESGGFWDHLAPPAGDRFGPGTRVPTLVISPLARKGFIDTTTYDSASILSLIEHRYGLDPLAARDAAAADMSAAFDFSQP